MKSIVPFIAALGATSLSMSSNTDIEPGTKFPWTVSLVPGRTACLLRCYLDSNCGRGQHYTRTDNCSGITLTVNTKYTLTEITGLKLLSICGYIIAAKSFCQHHRHCRHLGDAACQGNTCLCNNETESCAVPKETLTIQSSCDCGEQCRHQQHAECYEGACRCKIGYSFDHLKKACRNVSECRTFNDNFELHKRYTIFGPGALEQCRKSSNECLDRCKSNPTCNRVECSSFSCVLWVDFNNEVKKRLFFKVYQRQCNW